MTRWYQRTVNLENRQRLLGQHKKLHQGSQVQVTPTNENQATLRKRNGKFQHSVALCVKFSKGSMYTKWSSAFPHRRDCPVEPLTKQASKELQR